MIPTAGEYLRPALAAWICSTHVARTLPRRTHTQPRRPRALARQTGSILSSSVPACPGWTLDALFGHLGSIERWAAAAVAPPRHRPGAGPSRGQGSNLVPRRCAGFPGHDDLPGPHGAVLELRPAPAHGRFLASPAGTRTRHPPRRRPPGVRPRGSGVRRGLPPGGPHHREIAEELTERTGEQWNAMRVVRTQKRLGLA